MEFVSKHETPSAVSPVGPPGFSVRSITLGGIALALAYSALVLCACVTAGSRLVRSPGLSRSRSCHTMGHQVMYL